jgi:hypothetical protein
MVRTPREYEMGAVLVAGVYVAAEMRRALPESAGEGRAGRGDRANFGFHRPRVGQLTLRSGPLFAALRAAGMPFQRMASGADRSNWSRTRVVMWPTRSAMVAGWL